MVRSSRVLVKIVLLMILKLSLVDLWLGNREPERERQGGRIRPVPWMIIRGYGEVAADLVTVYGTRFRSTRFPWL